MIAFATVFEVFRKSADAVAVCKQLERPASFLSNLGYNIRKNNQISRTVIEDIYAAFPVLKFLVEQGAIKAYPHVGKRNFSKTQMPAVKTLVMVPAVQAKTLPSKTAAVVPALARLAQLGKHLTQEAEDILSKMGE